MLGWFRRHAKILMVVLGSSAMAIFGLGPVFDTLSQRGLGGGTADEVVATWRGGKITRNKLEMLEQRHYQSRRFLTGVQEAAAAEKGDDFRAFAQQISPLRDGLREVVDDQIISRFLMAERAKDEGVVASDGLVNDYIQMISGDAGFSNSDLERINASANNKICSLTSIREHLKLELLANQMSLFTLTGIPMIPNPSEAMELHGRSTEQIECEVLAVDVNEYAEKVTDTPPAAELKKLYEAGKHEFPDPRGTNPGFKIGRNVNVQYFSANYETYVQNEMNKLTDQEVQQEYDRLVKEESPVVTEVVTPDDSIQINSPPPTEPANGDAEKVSDSTDDVAAPPKDVDAPPSDVDAPPMEESDGEKAESKTEGSKAAPKQDVPAEKVKVKEDLNANPPAESKKQSLKVFGQKSQFVSFRQEEEAAKAKVKKEVSEAAQKTTDPVQESGGPESGEQAEGKDSEATQADDEKADTPGGIGGIEDTLKNMPEVPKMPEIERTVKPLKDVVDAVKRAMAEPIATKAMNDALTKAEVDVRVHFEQVVRYEYEKERGKGTPPGTFDYEATAKKYNLTANETGLVDYAGLAESPIGQVQMLTYRIIRGQRMPGLQGVGQKVFNEYSESKLFQPTTVDDSWGSKSGYLFWVAEKQDTQVPEYAECKDAVEKFWKQKKGYELAMTEAEAIKTKVNDARVKKMSDMYFERVFQTGAFTWFNNFGQVQLSTPAGVENPSNQFMETAFSLSELQAGVAPNEKKDKVYVVQSMTGSKLVGEIGEDYLENQLFKYKRIPTEVQSVSQWYGRELNLDWSDEFNEAMDLKYLNR